LLTLTPVAMVDNLAEMVNECPLNQGHYVLFVYIGSAKTVRYME